MSTVKTKLEVLEFPDSRLRIKAKPVKVVNDCIRQLAADMLETMYQAKGVGLSATQVNVHERVIVLDVTTTRDDPRILINPQFEPISDLYAEYDEGCLSVPGFYEPVSRPERIRVQAQNEQGEAQTFEADGLLGVCIQHECDHLDGKLFVDYLSSLKRQRIRRKLEKQQRVRT